MTTVIALTTPLEAALLAAQAELVAAPPGADHEWVLPASATGAPHVIASALTLGAAGKRLHLRGHDAVELAFTTGGLAVIGSEVVVSELRLLTPAVGDAAVAIAAASVIVRDLELPDVAGSGATTGLAIDAGATGAIDLDDVEVGAVHGATTIGVDLAGQLVRAARVRIAEVTGTAVTGLKVRATGAADLSGLAVGRAHGTAAATGADLAALGALSIAGLDVDDVAGPDATGAVVACGGDELRVVDLDVIGVAAAGGVGRGAVVTSGGDVVVRGFVVKQVSGRDALGLLALGGRGAGPEDAPTVEVAFGQVVGVSSPTTPAAGLRVLAARSPRPVTVRDVSVRGVYGGPEPAGPEPAPAPTAPDPAWLTWIDSAVTTLATAVAPDVVLPPAPTAVETLGLHVSAVFEQVVQFFDSFAAAPLAVADATVGAIHGAAVAISGGLRTTSVRRLAVDHAMRGGYLQGDRLVIANTTWHQLRGRILAGPGEVHAYDSIFSQVAGGVADPLVLEPDADWLAAQVLHADLESLRFAALGATPFRDPGGPVPDPWLAVSAIAPVDLHLVDGSPLHRLAVAPPPDALDPLDRAPFDGAFPPEAGARCDLYDPLRPGGATAEAASPPGPVVDYRARDAAGFSALMFGRARTTMSAWTDRGAADFTTMVIELLAERLDHLAYQQERAVSEGFLEDARLRRSVEDHVRPLDYEVDPGLSATALVRFDVDLAKLVALAAGDPARTAVFQELANDGALEIPAGTMVAAALTDGLVFTTEAPLTYASVLHDLLLDEPVARGATGARLRRNPLGPSTSIDLALAEVIAGAWLVLRRPDGTGHVVRVTSARGTDLVEIGWDPRRPAPFDLDPATTEVIGNLVPAHHGLRVAAVDEDQVSTDRRDSVLQIKAALALTLDGTREVEVVLPFHPISQHAPGYPFPGEVRRGTPQLAVTVEGEAWTRVDDLSIETANREVYALRSSADGRSAIRFATTLRQGVLRGLALPQRTTALVHDPLIGLGAVGNVGAEVLTRLLFIPFDTSRTRFYADLFQEQPELLRGVITVTNPLPAVGGRDPEALPRIKYRAPLLLLRPLSAIAPEDYVRVATALPEVAAAHATVVPGVVRPIVRVTVLLRDEDTLDDAERLRRWALVRKALEDARLIGYDVETVPPRWVGLDLDVVVDAEPTAEAGAVRDAVLAAVAGQGGLFDPDVSGLGGDVHLAELYRAVAGARGVASAHVRRFRRLALHAPERVTQGVIAIAADEVAIVRGPGRPTADGVLSVTVCGGLT